jgi:anti-sigma factor RsiW
VKTSETPHLSDVEIQSLLDGALHQAAARAADAHLAVCPHCAARFEVQTRLHAAIASRVDAPPPHDLAPRVLAALRPSETPLVLRWASALQAALALLILALGWPLVASLTQNLRVPAEFSLVQGGIEALSAEVFVLSDAVEAMALSLFASAHAWLRTSPEWLALWPAVVAGAAFVAVVGNSILLTGSAAGSAAARPRRL